MKKRIITCICALAILMSLGASPAFASAGDDFTFSLLRGADSSATDAAYKNDYLHADIYPQSGYISTSNGDGIASRIRDANRDSATGLYIIHSISYYAMYYFNGVPGNYYFYAQAPSANYSQYVSMEGVWYP